VASLNLSGYTASLATAKNWWNNAQVITAAASVSINLAKFPLGNFYTDANTLTESIDGAGYKLDNTGKLVTK
jgi:hypothetical protein